jgi:predicted AAA+ superfamily ATPase
MEIKRSFYAQLEQRLTKYVPLIQIILGPRQVGKSTAILSLLKNFPKNSLYLALDVPGPNPEQTIRFTWQKARAISGHKILVIDEIQNVENWAALVKELYDEDRGKGELSVALLGSSALELAVRGEESLQGRFEIIRAHHWNFYECKQAFNWNLTQFLQFGGYPVLGSILTDNTDETLRRCQLFVRDSIIEPVISRDILALRQVLNSALLRQTLQLSLSLPCEEVSFSKLLGQLTDRGNSTTMKSYLELLEKAFLLKLLYRYSGGQIRMRTSTPKLIPLAPALVHAFSSPARIENDPAWAGHLFEAAVISRFNELGYELYYWSNSREDVDLVAKDGDLLIALEIKSNQTLDWRGLKAFKKEYPKAHIAAIDQSIGEQFLSAEQPGVFLKSLLGMSAR